MDPFASLFAITSNVLKFEPSSLTPIDADGGSASGTVS